MDDTKFAGGSGLGEAEFAQLDRATGVDAAMSGHADRHRPETVVDRDLGLAAADDGITEPFVFDEGRTVVKADVRRRDQRRPGRPWSRRRCRSSAHPRRPTRTSSLGSSASTLPMSPDDANLLLVEGGVGEHTEIEHGSGSAVVVDDNVGVVENVAGGRRRRPRRDG